MASGGEGKMEEMKVEGAATVISEVEEAATVIINVEGEEAVISDVKEAVNVISDVKEAASDISEVKEKEAATGISQVKRAEAAITVTKVKDGAIVISKIKQAGLVITKVEEAATVINEVEGAAAVIDDVEGTAVISEVNGKETATVVSNVEGAATTEISEVKKAEAAIVITDGERAATTVVSDLEGPTAIISDMEGGAAVFSDIEGAAAVISDVHATPEVITPPTSPEEDLFEAAMLFNFTKLPVLNAIDRIPDEDLKKRLLNADKITSFEVPSNEELAIIAKKEEEAKQSKKQGEVEVPYGLAPPMGTGKTVTISATALQRLDRKIKSCQVIILVPNRIAAKKLEKQITQLGEYLNVTCRAFHGQTLTKNDEKLLETGVQIVIGNPDRVEQMIERGHLRPDNIKLLVIEEPNLLMAGKYGTITIKLHQRLAKPKEIIFLCGNKSADVSEVCQKLKIPYAPQIVEKDELSLQGINQLSHEVESEDKRWALQECYWRLQDNHTVIICNSNDDVMELNKFLIEDDIGFELIVSAVIKDMDLKEREGKIRRFLTGPASSAFITNDYLSCITHLQDVPVMINYDLPTTPIGYIHRVGRFGGFDRPRVVYNFIRDSEMHIKKEIEEFYQKVKRPVEETVEACSSSSSSDNDDVAVAAAPADDKDKDKSKKNSKKAKAKAPVICDKVYSTFKEMGLKPELIKEMEKLGYKKPSKFQEVAIVPCIKGRNVIGQAGCGTGKTVMASIVALQTVDPKIKDCQALIIVPTREAAKNIEKQIAEMGKFSKVTSYACIGGTKVASDIENLEKGAQVCVGTPGRVQYLVTRKILVPDQIRRVIVDDAETMLSWDMRKQIYDLLNRCLSKTTRLVLMSKTVTDDLSRVAKKFMKNPAKVTVDMGNEVFLEGIKHFYWNTPDHDSKWANLMELYGKLDVSRIRMIIFCNSRTSVESLAKKLRNEKELGIANIAVLHGAMVDKDSDKNMKIMKKMMDGGSGVIISTDWLTTGVTVPEVSLVLNYDLANDRNNYISRISRGYRVGNQGVAISFAIPKDQRILKDIKELYQIDMADFEKEENLKGLKILKMAADNKEVEKK